MSHPFGLGLQRSVNHRFDPVRFVSSLATPARSDLPKAWQPSRGKTLPPQTNCFAIDIYLGGNGCLGFPVPGRQNDAAAEGPLTADNRCSQ